MFAEQRRDPRFSLRANESINAVITAPQCGTTMPARVVDISRQGAKLELDGHLPTEGETKFQLLCDKVNWSFEVPGRIHWKHPTRNDGWCIGCSFDDSVERKALERLASAGIIDRRIEPRESINKNVVAKLELNNGETEARLVDVSPGGFKVWIAKTVNEGERIVLFHNDEEETQSVGRTCWVNPTGDGFFVGCSFVQRDGYVNLVRALGLHDRTAPIAPSRAIGLAHGLSLVAGVGAVAFGFYGLFQG
jgi:hypothetical protein